MKQELSEQDMKKLMKVRKDVIYTLGNIASNICKDDEGNVDYYKLLVARYELHNMFVLMLLSSLSEAHSQFEDIEQEKKLEGKR